MDFDNDPARRLLVMFGVVCDESCNRYKKMGKMPEEKREELKHALSKNRALPDNYRAEDYFMTAVLGAYTMAKAKGRNKITKTDVIDWFTGNGHNKMVEMFDLEDCKGFKGKVLNIDGNKVSVHTAYDTKICEPLFYHPKVGETVAIHHNKIICSV